MYIYSTKIDKSMEKRKCILLVRVSTKAQSVESQTLKVKEQALRDGYSDSDMYIIEDVESGSKLSEEERSGLNKLKHYIENDDSINMVYAYEISRISRQTKIVYSIRDYLISKGVNLTILNPFFVLLKEDGSMNEMASIVFSIFSGLSEQETYLRVQRIMRGKEKKKSEGKLTCGKPIFGYTTDKDKKVIVDGEQSKIVREIFERYSNLESSGSIGRDLYLRNALPTKSNKMITYQTYISWMLRDKRYAGLSDDNIYPPIITKELFDKVQEIIGNKPAYFTRKSLTVATYPLQGYLFNEEGYALVPSITNNRYVKMKSNGTATPISLNMKCTDELTKMVMKKYLSSGVKEIDREKELRESSDKLAINKVKLSQIDSKIETFLTENERINARIIKGRMSESVGDSMIDSNMKEVHALEDERLSLSYQNNQLNNRIIYLSNPILYNNNNGEENINTKEDLKNLVIKYIKKVVVKKVGFSRYCLNYNFLDGTVMVGEFYSMHHNTEYKYCNYLKLLKKSSSSNSTQSHSSPSYPSSSSSISFTGLSL